MLNVNNSSSGAICNNVNSNGSNANNGGSNGGNNSNINNANNNIISNNNSNIQHTNNQNIHGSNDSHNHCHQLQTTKQEPGICDIQHHPCQGYINNQDQIVYARYINNKLHAC